MLVLWPADATFPSRFDIMRPFRPTFDIPILPRACATSVHGRPTGLKRAAGRSLRYAGKRRNQALKYGQRWFGVVYLPVSTIIARNCATRLASAGSLIM